MIGVTILYHIWILLFLRTNLIFFIQDKKEINRILRFHTQFDIFPTFPLKYSSKQCLIKLWMVSYFKKISCRTKCTCVKDVLHYYLHKSIIFCWCRSFCGDRMSQIESYIYLFLKVDIFFIVDKTYIDIFHGISKYDIQPYKSFIEIKK